MVELNTIECIDNLHYLNKIESDSVDLIFSDVLFNTGKSFDSYTDQLGDDNDVYKFYYPRIERMRTILKDSGLIYIQCDHRINYMIRLIMNKIFGASNFRNEIIWQFNSAPRKTNDFGNRHNTIFRYSKTDDYYFNADSPYVREAYSLTAPRGYAKEKYYSPLGKVRGSVWTINNIGQNDKTERVGYSTQKPLALLYPIIDSSCPPAGIVADFFLGSGTTVVAAKELGRNYLGCDINPQSIEITNKRLN